MHCNPSQVAPLPVKIYHRDIETSVISHFYEFEKVIEEGLLAF